MAKIDRIERLNSLIRREISEILLYKIKDPRIGFVTVTNVSVSRDLRYAKVYISVFDKDEEEVKKGLESAKKFIRGILGKRLKIKYIPELIFIIDHSLKEGDRILKIMKDIDE